MPLLPATEVAAEGNIGELAFAMAASLFSSVFEDAVFLAVLPEGFWFGSLLSPSSSLTLSIDMVSNLK